MTSLGITGGGNVCDGPPCSPGAQHGRGDARFPYGSVKILRRCSSKPKSKKKRGKRKKK